MIQTPALTERQKQLQRIRNIAVEMALLSKSDLKYFIELFTRGLPEGRVEELVATIVGYQHHADGGRYLEIEKWMESHFLKHMDYTPIRMAYFCMNQLKINTKMKPKMIVLAQKIKKRVRTRYNRQGIPLPVPRKTRARREREMLVEKAAVQPPVNLPDFDAMEKMLK